MATSSEAFKSLRKAGVVVFADSTKDTKYLPEGARTVRSEAGNMIPMAFVTSADGTEGIQGITYASMKEDMRGVVKELRKKLEDKSSEAAADQPPAGLLAKEQTWTNAEGKTLKAAVKAADDENVSFVMPNGTVVKYPLSKLSEESREKIAELVK